MQSFSSVRYVINPIDVRVEKARRTFEERVIHASHQTSRFHVTQDGMDTSEVAAQSYR